MKFVEHTTYRKDIDGLRAIAVLAAMAYHFGVLANGFLGVDVFFVISGYLITRIIHTELIEQRFSLVEFYIRRIRRIIPLTLFVVAVAFVIGLLVMLPDDLENLAQAVVATNIFGNNILQALTTHVYWNIANDFRPLMHTWSLGVEEQFYVLYPLLVLMLMRLGKRGLLVGVGVLALISLLLCFMGFPDYQTFYFLPFRFYELAFGGVAAIAFQNRLIQHKYSILFVLGLLGVLFFPEPLLSNPFAIALTVFLTVGILISANELSKWSSIILTNKLSIGIGLISFSLYMWHQVILAYMRYFVIQMPTAVHYLAALVLTFIISIITFYAIERPFRNKLLVSTTKLLIITACLFLFTTLPALYIHFKAGVIKDVPELGIYKSDAQSGLHYQYNDRIHAYSRPFKTTDRVKVLLMGNSFARDWGNVLMESSVAEHIEIVYIFNPYDENGLSDLVEQSDVIFYANALRSHIDELGIDQSKFYVVGTKNFGTNSGYFYNYSGDDYFAQRTRMEHRYYERNEKFKAEWGSRYMDLIGKVMNDEGTLPVFTPEQQFISQDGRHLTESGAKYFANLFNVELIRIIDLTK